MKKAIFFLSDGADGETNNRIAKLNELKIKYEQDILAFWTIGFGGDAE
jgi:hypothetical protein